MWLPFWSERDVSGIDRPSVLDRERVILQLHSLASIVNASLPTSAAERIAALDQTADSTAGSAPAVDQWKRARVYPQIRPEDLRGYIWKPGAGKGK